MTIRTGLAILTIVLFILSGDLAAESQLAPFYQRLLKGYEDRSTYDAMASTTPDLFKVIPAEEIPAMIDAINSGNPILMSAGVLSATEILTIHRTDGENPNFRRLKPPLPEVMREFQALVPVLVEHFGDLTAPTVNLNGETDYTEIGWKTNVIEFMDRIGATPTPDMLQWMLKVVQWPRGRVDDSLAKLEEIYGPKKLTGSERGSIAQEVAGMARATALIVIPALAHLNPMPPEAMAALLNKIDDASEPQAAALAISSLAENRVAGTTLSGELTVKALDEQAPAGVRVAAIMAIGKLKLTSALPELRPLIRHPNEEIAGAANAIGVPR